VADGIRDTALSADGLAALFAAAAEHRGAVRGSTSASAKFAASLTAEMQSSASALVTYAQVGSFTDFDSTAAEHAHADDVAPATNITKLLGREVPPGGETGVAGRFRAVFAHQVGYAEALALDYHRHLPIWRSDKEHLLGWADTFAATVTTLTHNAADRHHLDTLARTYASDEVAAIRAADDGDPAALHKADTAGTDMTKLGEAVAAAFVAAYPHRYGG
jgi:hypothetical protein